MFGKLIEKLAIKTNYILSLQDEDYILESFSMLVTEIYGLYDFGYITSDEFQELHSLITSSKEVYENNTINF